MYFDQGALPTTPGLVYPAVGQPVFSPPLNHVASIGVGDSPSSVMETQSIPSRYASSRRSVSQDPRYGFDQQ